jgi:hypothetical protein
MPSRTKLNANERSQVLKEELAAHPDNPVHASGQFMVYAGP